MKEDKLSLNDLAVAALRESAKWCMFLSIVGFIFIGLMVVMGAFMAVAMSAIDDPYGGGMGSMNPFMAIKGYLGAFYIVLALLYFFPVYYLFNYAKGTKQALDSGNSDVLSDALVNLKSHHKFLGIFTIITIGLYIIGIICVVVFAARYASAGGM
jgi:heme/copper-type cytochrome/quinol oxidase subunit 2